MIEGNALCFIENWYRDAYATKNQTTVNSVSTADHGVIDLTSSGTDPFIHMPSLGSFAPATYKYVHILYRVVGASGGTPAIYYYNAAGGAAADRVVSGGAYTADGAWHVKVIDMSSSAKWLDSNITGWRFDWTATNAVNMQFGYIALSSSTTELVEDDINLLFPYVPTLTVITYTSGSGNWTCPAGVTSVYVECWGTGGACGIPSSSDSYPACAGGGGGGAYAASTVAVTPGNTYAYSIGQYSGNTTFNSTTVVAARGSNSPNVTTRAGAGGAGGTVAASTGTVRYAGGAGASGYSNRNTNTYRGGGGGGGAGSAGAGGAGSSTTGGAGTDVGGGAGGYGATYFLGLIKGGDGVAYGGGGGGGINNSSGGGSAAVSYGGLGAVRITYEA